MTSFASTREFRKLALLTVYFVIMAVVLYSVKLGQLSWYVILVSALVWFGLEARENRGRITGATKVGAFLLVFDFIFENSGWLAGLWYTKSEFHVGVVPLQVMGIAFFGGAAWALYLPRKFNLWHSVVDCIVFATFGGSGGAAHDRAGALRLPALVDQLRRLRRLFPHLGGPALRQVPRLLQGRKGRCSSGRAPGPYSSIRLIANEASDTKRIVEKEIAAMSSGRFE